MTCRIPPASHRSYFVPDAEDKCPPPLPFSSMISLPHYIAMSKRCTLYRLRMKKSSGIACPGLFNNKNQYSWMKMFWILVSISKVLALARRLIELFFNVITVTQRPRGDLFQLFITWDQWGLSDRFGPETSMSVMFIIIVLNSNTFQSIIASVILNPTS